MGIRELNEPEYPQSREEVDTVCVRLIEALRTYLGERLVCVLLCGSWARGEARPPESDLDVTVIVDRVDDQAVDALRRAWEVSGFGFANIYGADEVNVMAREEMYTTNAIVLWGENPFRPPTRLDFAQQVSRAAESIARNARFALILPWKTPEGRVRSLRSIFHPSELGWTLKYLAAFRSGEFPRNYDDVRAKLAGMPEEELLVWLDQLTDGDLAEREQEIARRMNDFARSWMGEIALCIQSGNLPPGAKYSSEKIDD